MEDENVDCSPGVVGVDEEYPAVECPDGEVEEMHYFRWWSFRSRRKDAAGSRSPIFNSVRRGDSQHVAVAGPWPKATAADVCMWMITRLWFRGRTAGRRRFIAQQLDGGRVYDRYLVNGDRQFIGALLEDLVADYRIWQEKQLTNVCFGTDVRDGMEESISGSRTNGTSAHDQQLHVCQRVADCCDCAWEQFAIGGI
jgi:hypothetical protein